MQTTLIDFCRKHSRRLQFSEHHRAKCKRVCAFLSITVVWSEIRPVIPIHTQW